MGWVQLILAGAAVLCGAGAFVQIGPGQAALGLMFLFLGLTLGLRALDCRGQSVRSSAFLLGGAGVFMLLVSAVVLIRQLL